jgi:insecticidal toxin complex protein TccC
LELDDKVQTLSYEHYYPYGGTAIIAGKDKTQVQQKRYRYRLDSITVRTRLPW